ncbi:MAG: ArsA family ATPase [Chloroflexi bacterium]|nr:ArsA family ATPase [Chloroflexota bacterium]
MRILLYTGKGGVGKTSVAAATAIRCAALGYRTVVMSTDLAHSLADSLDTKLAPEPIEIAPRLWAQEIDIYYNLQHYWGRVQEWLSAVLAWREVDEVVADEVSVLPGMEELASLLCINRHRESRQYDVIVVDCAPTGETLRLLSFPEIGRWWIDKIMPIHKVATQFARPFVRAAVGLPLPSSQVYDAVEDLFNQLDRLHQMLVDPELTSVRLVVNPEKMVVRETQRTYAYLNLFGYPSDLVVCNRVLPGDVGDGFFDAWKKTQARHLAEIEQRFAPMPIREVPLFDDEVVGLERLGRMAHAIYQEEDPSRVFYRGATQQIERTDTGYRLTIPLPFTSKSDVHLVHVGDELIVQVGAHKRNIILPRLLAGLQTAGARFEGQALHISFVPTEAGEARAGRASRG